MHLVKRFAKLSVVVLLLTACGLQSEKNLGEAKQDSIEANPIRINFVAQPYSHDLGVSGEQPKGLSLTDGVAIDYKTYFRERNFGAPAAAVSSVTIDNVVFLPEGGPWIIGSVGESKRFLVRNGAALTTSQTVLTFTVRSNELNSYPIAGKGDQEGYDIVLGYYGEAQAIGETSVTHKRVSGVVTLNRETIQMSCNADWLANAKLVVVFSASDIEQASIAAIEEVRSISSNLPQNPNVTGNVLTFENYVPHTTPATIDFKTASGAEGVCTLAPVNIDATLPADLAGATQTAPHVVAIKDALGKALTQDAESVEFGLAIDRSYVVSGKDIPKMQLAHISFLDRAGMKTVSPRLMSKIGVYVECIQKLSDQEGRTCDQETVNPDECGCEGTRFTDVKIFSRVGTKLLTTPFSTEGLRHVIPTDK